ncbi:squalene-associated FAD-dependent desaturase [Thiogranum longum]|uniref:Squalene-associated FAD-dependent desaturase n=1 Tax=Thiogranum longum TaxID=1537524 RepID=A0A4R1H9S6_9GAMM|nr:hydroxysqualene dehydroxylase HpnE [Thiogranum longum]TCK18058.1 squalene-associated FAD-dependent desaturase [Thiogranum longum]
MPELTNDEAPVVIVGGGWAGLSAAITLTRRNVPVMLLESARQLGGRARSIRFGETVVDNGQHLMIGAYQSMLSLLQDIGLDLDKVLLREPLSLTTFHKGHASLQFHTPRLPAPLHLLSAILFARGLGLNDRLQALRFGRHLKTLYFSPSDDISVQALLHSEKQTPAMIRRLWEPLCIATLNTPITEASARIFLRVLKDAFLQMNRHCDLLFSRVELGNLLPTPAAAWLETHGAQTRLGERVTGLSVNNPSALSVCIGQKQLPARHIVLATPHIISRRLMSHHRKLKALCRHLEQLGNEPIITLYVQYPDTVSLPQPMVGIEEGLAQWLFDRRVCGQPGLIAVVISARGKHSKLDNSTLARHVIAELAETFPGWPGPSEHRVIREKRATFSSQTGIDAIRPGNHTPVDGLWLAGDYTDTGLPATLEGAIRSGVNCANAIIKTLD